jgi:hypothetical protein
MLGLLACPPTALALDPYGRSWRAALMQAPAAAGGHGQAHARTCSPPSHCRPIVWLIRRGPFYMSVMLTGVAREPGQHRYACCLTPAPQ